MFLDEGTANLDAQTEGRVLETLDGLDVTQVIVAHRQAAIAMADRVFVVAEGGLDEAGGAPAPCSARDKPARPAPSSP